MQLSDRVGPEPAKRLRDAGFKQPPPAPGQVWYMHGYPVFICAVEKKKSHTKYTYVRIGETYTGYTTIASDFECYAATPNDILWELGNNWSLDTYDNQWRCFESIESGYRFYNNNPAEACSEAWEYENKQRRDELAWEAGEADYGEGLTQL